MKDISHGAEEYQSERVQRALGEETASTQQNELNILGELGCFVPKLGAASWQRLSQRRRKGTGCFVTPSACPKQVA